MNPYYLIEFKSDNEDLQKSGFEVCLTLATLDLPLNIVITTKKNTKLTKQLKSLTDYGMATIYEKAHLTATQYVQLLTPPHFSLCF